MKAKSHARSNSLPSESHPVVADLEDKLRLLRALEATSSSVSSLCKNLAALEEMYECADNLLQLQATQKAFSNERLHDKFVDDMLDGSLKLLDTCSSSKDALSQIKGCVRDLESSLRRKIRCKSSLVNEIRDYFISRKQVNKFVCNCFGNMKRMQKSNATLVESDDDLAAMANMLNEVEAVSLTVFKSLLSFLYSPKSKSAGWSLVSKLVQSKPVYKEDNIDNGLEALIIKTKSGKKESIDMTQVQTTLKNLKAFESAIQELEEGLECGFRCLIKTRMSLLNLLNH
ncbi:hypothetical protein GOBAR_AA17874 [Gossypium barbadense]|uniref:DUF241 domain-containing protein n=2 Tax=Gossypium TaxID=3633 RepID=A0A2P5XHF1_GOSBA|nr:hypothetical protein GOBAR_AA17874 [Gossypium barbadense]TYI42837.1 hypothetical protein ES332_A01G126500v1 [Gossypium tomentosum]